MINEGMDFRSVTLSDLKEIAQRVVKELAEFRVWLFYGEMGSGKTTLIKEILQGSRCGGHDEQPYFFDCK
jgi:tRNA threonylcarbamoyladenosine biosynthesis protein TsaE